LLLRSEELAKGWLLALVEDAPLEAAAAILAAEVARDGPRICDAVVRALTDDADLRRIEREGVLEPLASRAGEVAGADSAEAAIHAVEALKDVVWSALRDELSRADADLLLDAAERLALVADLIRAAVLRRQGAGSSGQTGRVAPLRVAGPVAREGGGAPGLVGSGGKGDAAGGAAAGSRVEEGEAAEADERDVGPVEDGESEHSALWVGALRDEIVRAARARLPLSLLLVELEEAEKLLAVEPHAHASGTFGRFAQAVRSAVRRRDVLACETDSRAWIIARDTGRAGAQALGSRIATSVPGEESWRGAPLTVSVGVAVLGEDGHNAAALIDAAEQTRFAAEASGIGIVADGLDEEENGDPPAPGPSLVS
jgi:GGDEF domain-containing protein